METTFVHDSSSFRDPSGQVLRLNGTILRQVNHSYKEHYDKLIDSGLYKELCNSGLLVPHEEAHDITLQPAENFYKVLKPEVVSFISYPYEWSFSQLKDAALATLEIQKIALSFDMTLKDASAYNIQFVRGRPKLIDTLSFERYVQGTPWIAYRQFCRHFLAPLALMSYRHQKLSSLLMNNIDGVPLDLASSLLPLQAWLNIPLLIHLFLHSRSEGRFANTSVANVKSNMPKAALEGLVLNLQSAVESLKATKPDSHWLGYYKDNTYSKASMSQKEQLVQRYLRTLAPRQLWDIGANTGAFSRIASSLGIETISMDYDHACVEANYLWCRERKEEKILPLVIDLTSPSPGIGWANQERLSLTERGPADAVLALALIHHLAIANNVPIGMIAQFFARIANSLIIEFVPKSDSQVQRLLASRIDIFSTYDQQTFEHEFSKYFSLENTVHIENPERILYMMRKLS